jgi:AcrR family transcriptional regulator
MNKPAPTRTYVQRDRARAAQANTERILQASLDLFTERPLDQITLASVAERAGVGLQTVIRRVGTKDGLIRATNEWVVPQIIATRGAPPSPEPRTVAEAIARHYERWGALTDRMLRQEDSSPVLGELAATGRANHRAWIEATFADTLAALSPDERHALRARLVGVTGIELWQVLRHTEDLSADRATDAVADLISACLSTSTTDQRRES